MAELALMCGPSGVGKSTFVEEHLTHYNCVSRDKIRFGLLKPDEDYFAHEDEVHSIFISSIANSVMEGRDTLIDCTNLSPKVRKRLLGEVYKAMGDEAPQVDIVYYCFELGLEENLRRNSLRVGRAYVPEQAIMDMRRAYKRPTYNEVEDVTTIFVINEKGEIKVV